MKEIVLPTNKKIIDINVFSSEVFLRGDNINYTKLAFTNDIDCKEDKDSLSLIEQKESAIFDLRFLKHSLLTEKKTILIDELTNRGVIKDYNVNSRIILTLPKDSRNTTIKFTSANAGITINDILYSELKIETIDGEIIMRNTDGLNTIIKSVNGDIHMQIDESALNYTTHLKSVFNDAHKYSMEKGSMPTLLENRHNLEATTTNGDLSVLFLGKCKH